MILVSRTAIWGLRLLVLLPITAACTPHEDPCLGISQPRSCLNEGGGGLSFVFEPNQTKSDHTEPKHTEPLDHDDHYTGPDLDRDYDDHDDDEDHEYEEDHDDNDSSEEADNDDSKQEHHDVS